MNDIFDALFLKVLSVCLILAFLLTCICQLFGERVVIIMLIIVIFTILPILAKYVDDQNRELVERELNHESNNLWRSGMD